MHVGVNSLFSEIKPNTKRSLSGIKSTLVMTVTLMKVLYPIFTPVATKGATFHDKFRCKTPGIIQI
jgi:hypothetical protein